MPSTPVDPITIDHAGVHVAGHRLRGCTRWTARHEPDRGTFEVQITLVTSRFDVDLDAGNHLLGSPMRNFAPVVRPSVAEPLAGVAQ